MSPSADLTLTERTFNGFETCVSRTARTLDWPIVFYMLDDFCAYGHMDAMEHCHLKYWFKEYQRGGAMPGPVRFHSPLTKKLQYLPALVDDMIDLWEVATNWTDLTDEESEADSLCGDETIDLYKAWPKNIVEIVRTNGGNMVQW